MKLNTLYEFWMIQSVLCPAYFPAVSQILLNPPPTPPPPRQSLDYSMAKPSLATFVPTQIVYQILALQSFFYFFEVLLFELRHLLTGSPLTLLDLFTTQTLSLNTVAGWGTNLVVLLSHFIGSLLLVVIVEKSKKCLDFTVTTFLVHFVLTCVYGGFPATWDWWIVNLLGVAIMVVMGEWFCSRRELADIPSLLG